MKNTGWHNESKRHSLARQGIKTGGKIRTNLSSYQDLKRGGMTGIYVTSSELTKFADKLGFNCIDLVIPLPNVPFETQKELIETCKFHKRAKDLEPIDLDKIDFKEVKIEDVKLKPVSEWNEEDKKKIAQEERVPTEYWETNTGSHGWCCKNCGTVTQWG